jgi:hypothetical protein
LRGAGARCGHGVEGHGAATGASHLVDDAHPAPNVP